jgi:DNA-binding GntR family transcriptional regulator
LAEWAAAQLRELIVSGQLPSGQRIYEQELAKRMGISRTPVREALRHLQREGLVSLTPNRETLVTVYTANDVREIYQVRAALEGMAARLAAEQRDDGEIEELFELFDQMKKVVAAGGTREIYTDIDLCFHDVILRAARNSRLTDAVQRLRSQTRRYLLFGLRTWDPAGMQHNLGEHRAIAEAIRDCEPDLAEARMRSHIMVSSGITVRRMEEMERSASDAAAYAAPGRRS